MAIGLSDKQRELMRRMTSKRVSAQKSHTGMPATISREEGFSKKWSPMPEHKECPDFSAEDFKNNAAVGSIYSRQRNK